MPGLESALAHNTEVSLNWLPNVGLALVAVSVDPPLSQADLDLLKSLYQYTPKVSILLTKADLLDERELNEVLAYVRQQLARAFGSAAEIFPYSIFEPRRDEMWQLKSSTEPSSVLSDMICCPIRLGSPSLDSPSVRCDAARSEETRAGALSTKTPECL
jgi:hypothetical protein